MSKVVKIAGASRSEGMTKVVKQRNHDGGRVPAELCEYAEQPLYILIALWCRHQKKWVGQKQISDTFAITERRASFQISYILRKQAQIHCLTRKIKPDGARRLCRELWVEEVTLTLPDAINSENRGTSCYQIKNDTLCPSELHSISEQSNIGKFNR